MRVTPLTFDSCHAKNKSTNNHVLRRFDASTDLSESSTNEQVHSATLHDLKLQQGIRPLVELTKQTWGMCICNKAVDLGVADMINVNVHAL